MALFKIFKGNSSTLPKTYKDGYCYFTVDDGKMYIDTKDSDSTGRICLNAKHADTADLATNATNAQNADKLDGYHESSFLRYRKSTNVDEEETPWTGLSITEYRGAYPDGITNKIYNWGQVITLSGGSCRFELFTNHNSSTLETSNGIQYRSGWGDDKKPWNMILDSKNFNKYALPLTGGTLTGTLIAPQFQGALIGNASSATKLQTARTINGTSFDGTGNITTANWGTTRKITIGKTGKDVNGSGNVSWNLRDIGVIRYHDASSDTSITSLDVVNTPSYIHTVSTTGGSVTTATKPSGMDNAWGIIHLHTHTGNYATQLGFGGTTGKMYFRNAYNTTTFGNWKILIDDSQTVNASSVSHTNYDTNGKYVPTMNFLSYWNGAYASSGASNLTYCKHGAFGTMATKSASSYLLLSGGTMTGSLKSSYVGGGSWISGTKNASFVAATATTASAGHHYQGWFSGKTQAGAWSLGALSGSEDLYFVYGTDANYNSSTNTTAQTRISSAGRVYGAVWNDYAEYRSQYKEIQPGYIVISAKDGKVRKTSQRLSPFDGVVSDTFGFAIGETDECKTPLAVAGRVLVYCEGDRNLYEIGDVVCASENGKACRMTREEIREWPDRIVGTVSEIPEYETWGQSSVEVNGRIWIKVK